MAQTLPPLDVKTLGPTRDRLRDAALVISSVQRLFVPKHPRDWQYGLEINMRGPQTQELLIKGQAIRSSIDLVTHKVRLDGAKWKLEEYDGPELFKNVRSWLESQGVKAELEEPKFGGVGKQYDPEQAAKYAEALWWLDKQFRIIKAGLKGGVTAPTLLYPHHFDLSLVWFPHDDDKQVGFGWSTGDETIAEPYLYLTMYPETDTFTKLKLPEGAYWQKDGFRGAILPYAELVKSNEPEKLLRKYVDVVKTAEKGAGLLFA